MLGKKELSLDELENVTGGASSGRECRYKVSYINPATGLKETHVLEGTYNNAAGYKKAIKAAQEWCDANGMIYDDIHLIVE